ncbi:SdpI family protein [Galbibacter sp. BG1]|uniref:SdpI family protein n=1 Tax=Galbibacter sp. BG1 TaxID=1170699 RepID=UPI0015BB0D40|nr:SdpI family protein [Galbibacter sp. BG1]QLE00495.1 SdpI family protein [Galbibacter sp. BG1]
MKTKKLPEWLYALIILIPFVYLAVIWQNLPAEVPLHFNYEGEVDRYGDKMQVLLIPILLPLLTYLILWAIPKIDPKKRIKEMGNKYDSLKFFLVISMSALACYIIFAIEKGSLNTNGLYIVIGVLVAGLGNYMQTIKPNYFIGVRTPWTLENDIIWKKTHLLTGRLWIIGGILIIAISFLYSNIFSRSAFIVLILTISFVPILYSYLLYRKT